MSETPDEKSRGVSQRIAEVLEKRGISQPQFAKMCGVSKQYMNFLLNGKRSWNERTLNAAARALNMPLSRLYDETELPGIDQVTLQTTVSVADFRRIKEMAEERMLTVEEYMRLALGEMVRGDGKRYSA